VTASNAFARHRDEIASILDERFYPLAWVEQEIAAGRIGLMHNDTAIIGIERRVYPGGAVELHGMFAAGAMAGVLELIDLAVDAARLAGCTVAAIDSKAAWGRVLKARGFAVDRTRIVKDLADGS
jgi:hypothetical protein